MAVITEVSLKLNPVPDVARTVVLQTTDAAAVAAFVAAVRTAAITATVFDVRWPEGIVAIRIESTPDGAAAQIELLQGFAQLEELSPEAGDALLEEHLAFPFTGAGAVLGIGVRPEHLATLLAAVAAAGGLFVGRATLVAGDIVLPDLDPERIGRVVQAVRDLGGNVQARRGDETHGLAAHTAAPGVAMVEAAIKQQLDPAGVLV